MSKDKTVVVRSGSSGIGIGCVLAIVLSYTVNHSVGWAILHGLIGWIYVLYYVFEYM